MSSQNYKHFSKAGYPRPKKNILVISCIDLRLTDNLMKFLSAENLENRYDLVTLAGASLCGANDETVSKEFRKKYKEAWESTLEHHIFLAVQLHQIQDVFIVEHEDCGAYQTFVDGINWEDSEAEWKCHHDTAEHLSQKIIGKKYFFVQHSDMRKRPTKIAHKKDQKMGAYIHYKAKKLNVHAFMMDVKGDVFHLFSK